MFEASAEGKRLTKDQLDKKSGHTDARKFLYQLAGADRDWKAVIRLPGKNARGYGLNPA